jgi:YcaO-like protein with predicted kinase domain
MNVKIFNELNRNYKDCLPDDTVEKIKSALKDCQIKIDSVKWTKFIRGLYSLRIESTNPFFGTNGKGRNRKYALASAYAEYIERLQNDLLILGQPMRKFLLDQIKSKSGYIYYPDEVGISYEGFMKMPKDLIQELVRGDIQESNEKILDIFIGADGMKQSLLAVPFYDVSSDSIMYIPLNMLFGLTGSTGMAAGNTVEEAIYQGLCEIIERYSASLVYFNRLTPPTIPNEYLSKFPKEYKIIEDIRSLGYHVVVKDFSCGKGLPAIGVIAYDQSQKNYRLNVGADTCFQVALSRCLTEILQGYESSEEWEEMFMQIPTEEFSYFFSDDEKSIKMRTREFDDFTINGNGVFPYSLFEDNFSYSFDYNTFQTQKNYKEEIKVLRKLFDRLGSELFVRDVSFLGFPSVYVYATKVSLHTRKNVNLSIDDYEMIANHKLCDIDELLNNTKCYLSPDFIDRIVEIYSVNLSTMERARMEDVFMLKFSEEHIMSKFPISYLFFLNRFHNKDYAAALRYFDVAMNLLQVKNNSYFDGLRNYIKSLEAGVSGGESNYNEMMKENIMDNLDLPNCPLCNKCNLKTYCRTNMCVNTHIRIVKRMSFNRLEQMNIRNYFVQ